MASKGKGIGGALKAAAASKIKPTTEEELRALPATTISPEHILGLSKPCQGMCTCANLQHLYNRSLSRIVLARNIHNRLGFLCKPSDNTVGLEFTGFKLRKMDEPPVTLVSHEKDDSEPHTPLVDDSTDDGRHISYEFSSQFLRIKAVGAWVKFRVGDKAVQKLRMIGLVMLNTVSLLTYSHAHNRAPLLQGPPDQELRL